MWVWDILVLWTPGPLNPWTLGLLDLFPPPTTPHTSPYILLPPPISSSYSPPLVWFGYGGRGGCEFWGWDWRWTFEKLWGGWVEPWDLLLLSAFYSSILLPPPSYSSQLLHPPPKPPPNSSYILLKGPRWLISSYKKRFQCYSTQKSFLGGWRKRLYTWRKRLCDIAIIASSSRSRSLEFWDGVFLSCPGVTWTRAWQ